MTSSCLSQFRGWKIPILVGVGRGHSGISKRLNGVLVTVSSYNISWTHQISVCSSFHLKFSHHISAPCSEAHLVSYSSVWGSLYCSHIFYSYVNYIFFNLINLSGINSNKPHVLLLHNEEIVPFPHYLVLNSCNLDGFEWMYKKGKWEEILELEVEDPEDMIIFSAEDLTWTQVYGDQVAVIPYSRFQDFISGEESNPNAPTQFVVYKSE